MLGRPHKDEYSSIYEGSIGKVPDGNVLLMLETNITQTVDLLKSIGEDKAAYRDAPGKWANAMLSMIQGTKSSKYGHQGDPQLAG